MSRKVPRFVWLVAVCFVCALECLCLSASALETPNTLMGVDGMVMLHQGLFRNAATHDGFNTFQFGPVQVAAGTLGRYKSFYFVETSATEGGGISHNARYHSDTPEHWTGTEYTTVAPLNITDAYYPVIDRAAFGQRFDPDQYQIEVKFKPNLAPFPIVNEATAFQVTLDQLGGYVWDAEAGGYKRAGEQIGYNIGGAATPINTWYATAAKDADGFATWTVPVTQPTFAQRGFYYAFGNNDFRLQNTLSNGGRVQNPDLTWSDVNVGYGPNFSQFGGGPSDPNDPGSKQNVPNGVPVLAYGSAFAGDDLARNLSVEVKSIALTKINPGSLFARLDANSGIAFRFGSGFTRGNTAAPIPVPNDPFGLGYLPIATDQISRFDENGMTNLFLNMRTPDNANEVHRFIVRGAPGSNAFDGTDAMVNVRARLTEPLTNAGIAQTLTLVAKELDGNDDAAGKGADEYTFSLALNQFNTSTFTTVSVPLSMFSVNTMPFGFTNTGDGSRTEFNLYEFGGLIGAGGGLLRMELEYMELRLPEQALVGDYNNDGAVNAADYNIWRDNLGGSGSLLGANRDPANGSGSISIADYNSWKAHFGESGSGSGGFAGSAVPEPATLSLLAWLLAAVTVGRRGLRS